MRSCATRIASASGPSNCSRLRMRCSAARRAERGPRPGRRASNWISRSISGPATWSPCRIRTAASCPAAAAGPPSAPASSPPPRDRPCALASAKAARIRSSVISLSAGVSSEGSSWIDFISPLPVSVIFTMPPPDWPSTSSRASSSCASASLACIACAFFIMPMMSTISRSCIVSEIVVGDRTHRHRRRRRPPPAAAGGRRAARARARRRSSRRESAPAPCAPADARRRRSSRSASRASRVSRSVGAVAPGASATIQRSPVHSAELARKRLRERGRRALDQRELDPARLEPRRAGRRVRAPGRAGCRAWRARARRRPRTWRGAARCDGAARRAGAGGGASAAPSAADRPPRRSRPATGVGGGATRGAASALSASLRNASSGLGRSAA